MKNQNLIKVVIEKVRFNYVNIFKPKSIKEGEEKGYSMKILIPKDSSYYLGKLCFSRVHLTTSKIPGESTKLIIN